MRNFFLLLIFSFCLIRVNSQTNFYLKRININPSEGARNEKDISRLSNILRKTFLQKATDSSTEAYRQLRQFFSQVKPGGNAAPYLDPITDSDISITVIHYNYSWNFTPVPADSLHKLEGHRDKELDAIISVPAYVSFHKGYEINTISFSCKLTEVIRWTEDENDLKPIEQLPDYSKSYNIKIRKVDFND